MIQRVWRRIRAVLPGGIPGWTMAGIGALLVLAAAYGVSGKLIGARAHFSGQAKSAAGASQNAFARLLSGFGDKSTGDGQTKLVVSPGVPKAPAFDCLASPVQDVQGLIWCIRKDRPSELACWDGEQWCFTELKGIAAGSRRPVGAAILVDDKNRVHVICERGTPGFAADEIDADAFKREYAPGEYLFVDDYLERTGCRNYNSLSPGTVAKMFNAFLLKHDLCSRVDPQRLGLGSSYLVQKVRTCDQNSSADMIAAANQVLLSKMYPRTFAKSFGEKAYRLERSSPSVVEVFPDFEDMLVDSVRSGSRVFRDNADHPPLVYKKKIVYDGRCFGSDTLTFAYVGKDAKVWSWRDNIVTVQFAEDPQGRKVPSKCMLCGSLNDGRMRAVYESDRQKPAAVLAGKAVKLPGHIDRVYPFKGGFSYFDPVSESIVLCSSGGDTSEIRMNEGLIGRSGIRVFDEKAYAENGDALFPFRKSGDGVLVFASRDAFDRPSSSGTIPSNAVRLPGYIENVYPVPGGFAVNDHRSARITFYLKDRVIETDPGFYGANKLNKDSTLFADAKGNLWINTGGRFIEIPRDEVFPR